MAASLFVSVYAGVNFPGNSALAALIAFGIYTVLVSLSTIFSVFVSLLLGKTDKLVLKKKVRHFIKQRSESHVELVGEDEIAIIVPHSEITETHTDTKGLGPHVVIEHYGIGGWRSFFLLPVYEDTLKFILYEDET
jgi:hypothetical protein